MPFRSRVVILASALLLLLTSCSSTGEARQSPSALSVTSALAESFPVSGGYAAYDESALRLYFPESCAALQDCAVIYSVRPDDYTEIGVFRLPEETDLRAVTHEVEAYLSEFRETYFPQAELYDKDQKTKLSDAAVRVIDRYVIYTVMSEKEQRLFWKSARTLLS